MPKSIKTVAKNYTYNTNYELDPRRFESVIKVLESSRDNLNKPKAVHIVLRVESVNFQKSLINEALTKTLSRKLKTGYGYYLAMEKNELDGFHIHILLTFSTGFNCDFTILNAARNCLYSLDGVSTAIAFPRKQERSVSIDIANYYIAFKEIKKTNNYFHDLKDTAQFNDAVQRYSYLAKNETKKVDELTGIRLTQSKIPTANKTKQEQKKRKINTKKAA